MKERKGNKSEKEVKPVKKSVALVLTLVTVFSFAAACFSLGYCSGKKMASAYAAVSGTFYFYFGDTVIEPSQDYAATFASCGVDYTSMWKNSDNYLCYTNPSETVQVYNYNTNKWVNEKYRYIYAYGTNSDEFFQFFTRQSVMPASAPTLYSGTYVWEDIVSVTSNSSFYMSFSSGTTDYQQILFTANGDVKYKDILDNVDLVYSPDIGWGDSSWKKIFVFGDNPNVNSRFYTSFLKNIFSFSTSSEPEPVEYTATVDLPSEVNFTIRHTTGQGVTYNEGSAVFTGPEGGTFTLSMVPDDGYRISIFSVVDTVDNPTGTVSMVVSGIYVMKFGAGNMELVVTASASLNTYKATIDEKTTGLYSFAYIEGAGAVYDENAETVTGAPGTYFQVRLMPFEGYMVDTFTVTDSDGTAKSIVKNSYTLYTITFGSEDFVLNISATVKPIVYTLTIQFKGVGFTHSATPTGNSEKISDGVFKCDVGSGAYVAIGEQEGYTIEEISYNVGSGVATIQESGINGYRVLRSSGNAVVTFSVTTKTDSVVIPSGYYWLRAFPSHPNFSIRYTIARDDFQAIKTIENGSIVWENLAGFIPYDEYSPWFYFESAPSIKVQVFKHGSYRVNAVPSGVDNPFPSPVALYYPVIYVPEDIKESRGYSSTLISFMTGGVYAYKSDVRYYNAFYVELPSTQASILTSLPRGLDGLTFYTPSQNTLVSPQSLSLSNMNNVVIGEWTIYYVVDFAGNPDRGEYTGAWFGTQGGQKRSVYNQLSPFYEDGKIYINSTVLPTSVYSFLNSAFNISSVPIDVDPPSADYWIGLDTVLSYQIFGIPLSVLLTVVVSSVFVVVVIRLFAGG